MKKNTINIKWSGVLILLVTIFQYQVSLGKTMAPKQNPTPFTFSFTEKDFNSFFPRHNKFYSYTAFKQAVSQLKPILISVEKRGDWIYKITRKDRKTGITKVVRQDSDWDQPWAKVKPLTSYQIDYGDFCNVNSIPLSKKELAAFFAQVAHETRAGKDGQYDDGLMLKKEMDTLNAYTTENKIYPAAPNKKYYGRGPLQLSYNGNYGFASDCLFGDKNVLLNQPDLVTGDPVLAFKTAIYFWMTPQSLKPSAHQVMSGNWKPTPEDTKLGRIQGFGMTINIINGALECNKGENREMNDRIGFYRHFLGIFKLKDNELSCSCAKMSPY